LTLWDIDGTLVNTAGHGRRAFFEAFERVFGRRPVGGHVPMAGRTDQAILLDMLERAGIDGGAAHLARMFEELHLALAARRGQIAREGRAQPGARAALQAVARDGGIVQSVLTGNIERNAQLKLAAFELDSMLELDIGGYGSDDALRSALVDVARRKVRAKHGVEVAVERTVLVGDTPLDVEAAHAAGARAVAVATGPYRLEELEQANPHAALEDLRDTGALLEALEG
jgi:phosphoglycolate phosphatase